jgi:THO complex subunit 2
LNILSAKQLYPSDEEVKQSYKEDFDNAKQYAKSLTVVNLSSNNEPTKASRNETNDVEMKADDESTTSTAQAQQQQTDKKYENQKVGLISFLIKINNFKMAIKLLEKLPQWYISTYVDVTKSVCKSINRIIDTLYSKYNTFTNELKKKMFANLKVDDQFTLGLFLDYVLPILCSVGPGLSYNTILLTKLIRICISFTETYTKTDASDDSKRFYDSIFALINEVFFPSLSMLNMNPCIAIELWNLLKMFPYEMRYCLYTNWRAYTYSSFPKLICIKADCQEKIKYLLKRLTKENVKIHGRQIGKLSHNNPIIICDYVSRWLYI